MASLTWTNEASNSIHEIYQSISRDRPETAQRTVESIFNRVETLAEYPALGQIYSYGPNPQDVRVFQYGNFKIAYLVENEDDVVILGVFHGLIFLPM